VAIETPAVAVPTASSAWSTTAVVRRRRDRGAIRGARVITLIGGPDSTPISAPP
jgi:hypothetical protein